MHSSEEVLEECEKCNKRGLLEKLVCRPLYKTKKTERVKKTGSVTEKFIEESREELLKQKRELEESR